jgi:hypothetical protein
MILSVAEKWKVRRKKTTYFYKNWLAILIFYSEKGYKDKLKYMYIIE